MKFYYTPQTCNGYGCYCWVYFLNRFGQVVTIGRVREKQEGYEFASVDEPRKWNTGQAITRGKAAALLYEEYLDGELDKALSHLHNLLEGSSEKHRERLARIQSWVTTWRAD